MTNEGNRLTFLTFYKYITTQVTRHVGSRVNANESTMTSRLRDSCRMISPKYLGSKVEEYPQRFVD